MKKKVMLAREVKEMKEAIYGLEGIATYLTTVDGEYQYGCMVAGLRSLIDLVSAKTEAIEAIVA